MTAEDVRSYLKPLSSSNLNSSGNALKPLKKFFRDFLKMGEVVGSFKFRKITLRPVVVPTKKELQRFYHALRTERARALFLVYASTGMRRSELSSLTKDDIDWGKRMVIPNNHNGNTKRSWTTFFNKEAEDALRKYLATRDDYIPKLFRISPYTFIDIWKDAYDETSENQSLNIKNKQAGKKNIDNIVLGTPQFSKSEVILILVAELHCDFGGRLGLFYTSFP